MSMKRIIPYALLLLTLLAESGRAGLTYTTNVAVGDDPTNQLIDHNTNGNSSKTFLGPNGSADGSTNVNEPPIGPPTFGAYANSSDFSNSTTVGSVSLAAASVNATDHLLVFAKPTGGGGNPLDKLVQSMVVTLSLQGKLTANTSIAGNADDATADVAYVIDVPYVGSDGMEHDGAISGEVGWEANTFGSPTGLIFGSKPNEFHQLVNGQFDGQFSASIPFSSDLYDVKISGFQEWTMNLQLVAEAVAHNAGNATANISDTLSIDGITFYDTNGNIIPGLGVMDDSGVEFPVVPEPSSLILAMAAAAMLFVCWSKLRRTGVASPARSLATGIA
jgi:hypothetical protein